MKACCGLRETGVAGFAGAEGCTCERKVVGAGSSKAKVTNTKRKQSELQAIRVLPLAFCASSKGIEFECIR